MALFEISKTTMKTAAVLLAVMICRLDSPVVAAPNEPAGGLLLGIVEPAQVRHDEDASAPAKDNDYRVCAAFEWKNEAWQAMPSNPSTPGDLDRDRLLYPARAHWTVGLAGSNHGEIDTARPPVWNFYGDIGILQPTPLRKEKQPVPVPVTGEGFSYWAGALKYRPLVAVSKPQIADPDRWKPEKAPPDILYRLIPVFRKAVGTAPPPCNGEPSTVKNLKPGLESPVRSGEAYVSAAGLRVVELMFDNKNTGPCEGPLDEAYDSRWFLVAGDNIRLLGQSLEWIDAGDYDNDGHSEIVFHKSGYNLDGYVLFYDRLRKEADFTWNYH